MKFYLLFFYFLFSFSIAMANYIGIENNFRHVGKIQIDDQGSTNLFEFSPGIYFGKSIQLFFFENLWFFPGAAIFIPKSSEDDLYSKWTAELNFHLLWPVYEQVDLIFGTTYVGNVIVGAGGTSVQGNGNSTSQYYVPKKSRFIGGLVPELGIRYEFLRAKYIYFGILTHQILDKDAKSFSLSLNLMTWI